MKGESAWAWELTKVFSAEKVSRSERKAISQVILLPFPKSYMYVSAINRIYEWLANNFLGISCPNYRSFRQRYRSHPRGHSKEGCRCVWSKILSRQLCSIILGTSSSNSFQTQTGIQPNTIKRGSELQSLGRSIKTRSQ